MVIMWVVVVVVMMMMWCVHDNYVRSHSVLLMLKLVYLVCHKNYIQKSRSPQWSSKDDRPPFHTHPIHRAPFAKQRSPKRKYEDDEPVRDPLRLFRQH